MIVSVVWLNYMLFGSNQKPKAECWRLVGRVIMLLKEMPNHGLVDRVVFEADIFELLAPPSRHLVGYVNEGLLRNHTNGL